MTTVAVILAVAVLAILAAVQAGAAAGAPWGRLLWRGEHRVLPPRLRAASAAAVVLYVGFAYVLLSRAGWFSSAPSLAVRIGTWVLAAYFALGIAMNLASKSAGERWTMAPASALLAAASIVISVS